MFGRVYRLRAKPLTVVVLDSDCCVSVVLVLRGVVLPDAPPWDVSAPFLGMTSLKEGATQAHKFQESVPRPQSLASKTPAVLFLTPPVITRVWTSSRALLNPSLPSPRPLFSCPMRVRACVRARAG